MKPLFTEEQLDSMSKENITALMQAMQKHQQKQETKIQILEEKTKELEFLNAMLSGRLTLAQRRRFGQSREKYADGYTQLNLFNEAKQESDLDGFGPELEEISATVYSITETALLNGWKPYNYLTYVLERMKDLGAFPKKEDMLELLPLSSNLPDDCRSKLKK